jgi:hypothetical protein
MPGVGTVWANQLPTCPAARRPDATGHPASIKDHLAFDHDTLRGALPTGLRAAGKMALTISSLSGNPASNIARICR